MCEVIPHRHATNERNLPQSQPGSVPRMPASDGVGLCSSEIRFFAGGAKIPVRQMWPNRKSSGALAPACTVAIGG